MSYYASVIFDLDGTLIDSEPGVHESFGKAIGVVLPDEKFDPESVVIGPPLPKMFAAAYPHATAKQIDDLVVAFRADYNESGWKKTQVFEGVEQTLATLTGRGLQLFVVTNKPLDISRKILRFFKLDGFFADIRSLDSINPPYANKVAMVSALVRERNLKAEQCVLIGDTKGDAEAAKAVGIPFVWASFGYGKRHDLPGSVKSMDSFSELSTLLS